MITRTAADELVSELMIAQAEALLLEEVGPEPRIQEAYRRLRIARTRLTDALVGPTPIPVSHYRPDDF